MQYGNIEKTADKQRLYDNLPERTLKEVDEILGAYFSERIDLEIAKFEYGESDFCGECELIVKDSNYVETGNELLVLKWVEDFEDTDYLIECLKEG